MPYRVEWKPTAERAFRKLPRETQERIRPAVDALAETPRPQGAKKLAGADDVWRIRVGEYRVVYVVRDVVVTVTVVRVAHRREVYRR